MKKSIDDILKETEIALAKSLGVQVKLSVIEVRINVQPNGVSWIDEYKELWRVCDETAKILMKQQQRDIININADAKKVYVFLAIRLFRFLNKKLLMSVIGKDRSTFYNTMKVAENMYSIKDECFLRMLTKTNEQLKINGHESIEI